MHDAKGDKILKIEVEENVFVESDGTQFLVKKYSGNSYKNKKGEEVEGYSVLGYYGTIEQVMNGLINSKIHESKATTFKELIEDMQQIRNDITKLLKE